MEKIIAIVQARCGSSRLPNKVLLDIDGMPMIQWVLERTKQSKKINKLIVATTNNKEDDILVEWCIKNKYEYFRGSEKDVLSRYFYCAKKFSGDLVVRITADDPLKDAEIIDEAITKILLNKSDYCSNTITPSYPEGLDIEVFTFEALEKSFYNAKLDSEREHVTPYIWKNSNLFKITELIYSEDISNWRLTIDKLEDINFIRKLTSAFNGNQIINYKDIIHIIKNNPIFLNSCIGKTIRNEGYNKSIQNEK